MAITNFVPELWSAAVQVPYEKALVFAQPNVANTDYEGQIRQMGDTVHVTSISAPAVRTYTKGTALTFDELTDTGADLVINQGDYFGFRVHDLDRTQAAGNFQGPATDGAGIKLRDKVDVYMAGLYQANALTANKLGRAVIIDADPDKATTGQTTAYQTLVKLREKLDAQSVPQDGRYVVVPGTFISALLMDKRYTDLSASGSTTALLNGQVGRGAGFQVLVSNNLQKVGGAGADKDDLVVCAGVPGAVSYANQLTEVEALRDQLHFGDLVRGLNVYGAKVFRPEGIATATVSFVSL